MKIWVCLCNKINIWSEKKCRWCGGSIDLGTMYDMNNPAEESRMRWARREFQERRWKQMRPIERRRLRSWRYWKNEMLPFFWLFASGFFLMAAAIELGKVVYILGKHWDWF